MKKAIIIGATSGIGQEVAGILVQQGWRIGIAGRREEVLRSMQQANPQQIEIQHLDVTPRLFQGRRPPDWNICLI